MQNNETARYTAIHEKLKQWNARNYDAVFADGWSVNRVLDELNWALYIQKAHKAGQFEDMHDTVWREWRHPTPWSSDVID